MRRPVCSRLTEPAQPKPPRHRQWLRRVAVLLVLAAALLSGAPGVRAEATKSTAATVPVDVFWSRTCPHCKRALAFLDRVAAANPRVRLRRLEIDEDRANQTLFYAVNDHFAIKQPAVPMIVIGGKVVVGYGDDADTGKQLAARIRTCMETPCPDPVARLAAAKPVPPTQEGARMRPPTTIRLPIVGQLDTAHVSLPVLTIAMAAVDGFNPCAMWALVFLIGLLLGLNNRRRMWLLGGVFIAASALVYFAILAAWLNVLLFLGALVWIRIAVAVVALGGGGYYLREFARGEVVCKVTAPQSRRHILDHLKALATGRHLAVAVLGIAVLAVAVNMIDLLCSAGLPAVYTEVLARNQLPAWQYYGYLTLYIVVFMADDLLVFFMAMATLKLSSVSVGFARYSSLVGGVLLIAIGIVLLVRPEWLTFA
jgi:glutaredoxin